MLLLGQSLPGLAGAFVVGVPKLQLLVVKFVLLEAALVGFVVVALLQEKLWVWLWCLGFIVGIVVARVIRMDCLTAIIVFCAQVTWLCGGLGWSDVPVRVVVKVYGAAAWA